MIIKEDIIHFNSSDLIDVFISTITIPSSLKSIDVYFDTSSLKNISLHKDNHYFIKTKNGLIQKEGWKLVLYENGKEEQDEEIYLEDTIMRYERNLMKGNEFK